MKKGSLVMIALIFALGALSNAYASYTFTSLDYPGGSFTGAFSINNGGTIVGTIEAGGLTRGFSLIGGTYTALDYPGVTYTNVGGINDGGTISGFYSIDGLAYAFTLSGGIYTALPDYPGSLPYTIAYDINNGGTIVGYYLIWYLPELADCRGFYLSGGTYHAVDYPGAPQTQPRGINNLGTIVGTYFDTHYPVLNSHAFSLSGGIYSALGDYPGALQTIATGINDLGTIVGYYKDTTGTDHGFILSGGSYTALDYPGSLSTIAYGINNGGKIVGVYSDATGMYHGFLATPDAVHTTISSAGFLPPVQSGAIKVKKNRVIPLKTELFDASGSPVINLTFPPVIQVWYFSETEPAIDVSDQTLSAGQGTEGNQFVFSDGKWQFNLETKNYTAKGSYTVQMVPGGPDYIIAPPAPTATFVIE
jgi:probable HAF family extracellular repeat protein